MRVDELMTSPVYSVRPGLSPKHVSRFLVEHGVGCAPVVDATGKLIGMVTEADLMRLALHPDPTRHQRRDRGDETAPPPPTIGELMTSEVVAVPVDFDVADAARLMLDRHLTRLPVMEGEQLVGILSRTDLLRVLVRDDVEIAQDVAARLAELPGGWTVEADSGVLTLRGAPAAGHRTARPDRRLGGSRRHRGACQAASRQCLTPREWPTCAGPQQKARRRRRSRWPAVIS